MVFKQFDFCLSQNWLLNFQLEKEIIRSIAYIMEVQSLVLAKAMYLRCGMLKLVKDQQQPIEISYEKPEIKQKETVHLITEVEYYQLSLNFWFVFVITLVIFSKFLSVEIAVDKMQSKSV